MQLIVFFACEYPNVGQIRLPGLKTEPFNFNLHTIKNEPKVRKVGNEVGELARVSVVEWGNGIEEHDKLQRSNGQRTVDRHQCKKPVDNCKQIMDNENQIDPTGNNGNLRAREDYHNLLY